MTKIKHKEVSIWYIVYYKWEAFFR